MSKRSARNSRAAAPKQAQQNRAAAMSASKYGGAESGVPENAGQTAPAAGDTGGGGLKGRILWLSALVLIASGYALLHKVDPGGQNVWAVASPALLLCGYLLIIPAIACTYPKK